MKKQILLLPFIVLLTACTETGQAPSGDESGSLFENETSPAVTTSGPAVEATPFAMASSDANNLTLFNRDVDDLIRGEEVISDGFMGFLAEPEAAGTYPGVIMIHEWWGLNDNIRQMAKILASEGYTVLAIDLYDGEVAEDSQKAGELAGGVRNNPAAAIAKMQAAVNYLREEKKASSVASLGWCFGGQQSLNLALSDNLDATVIYYGQLTDDRERLRNINWPVLGIFGEEDQSISVESVRNFETALNELNISNEITIYPGVGHAFANPSGDNFAPNETRDAWEKTLAFLTENLE